MNSGQGSSSGPCSGVEELEVATGEKNGTANKIGHQTVEEVGLQ